MAVRTVRVRLELDRDSFKQGLRDAAGDVRTFDGEVESLGKSAEKTGVELKDTGASAKQLGDDAKKSSRDTDTLGESVKKAGDESVKTSQKTRQSKASMIEFSDSAKLAGDGVDQLKAHLEELTARHEALKKEFVSSGNTSLLGDIKKAEQDVRSVASLIDKTFKEVVPAAESAGQESGKSFWSGLQGVLSTPVLGPISLGVLLVAAAAVAPLAGGIVAGGILAGIGTAGIGTALALQLSDPRVKGAAGDLGSYVKGRLTDATAGFAERFVTGFNILRTQTGPFFASLQAGFAKLAPYTEAIFKGLADGLNKLGPGLERSLSAAGPALASLANSLPTILNGFNIFFDEISKGGKGASEAITALADVISFTLAGAGFALRGLSDAFDFLVQKFAAVADFLAKFGGSFGAHKMWEDLKGFADGLAGSWDKAKASMDGAAGSMGALGGAAGQASSNLALVTGSFSALSGQANQAGDLTNKYLNILLTGDQANLAFHQSLTAVTDAVRQNGHETDINTAKGQANHEMALRAVSSNVGIYNSMIQSGASAQEAAAAYDQNTGALERQLRQAHFTQGQIDDLIGKYRNVPDSVNTNLELHGVAQAINNLVDVLRAINGLPPLKTIEVRTIYTSYTAEAVGLGASTKTSALLHHAGAKGGIVHYASGGVDIRDRAGVLAPSDPGTFLAGEPQTGGEVLTPKLGISNERGLALANVAAGWHGGHVVADGPRGGGGYQPVAFAPTYQITVTSAVGTTPAAQGQAIVSAIKAFERDNSAYWRGG